VLVNNSMEEMVLAPTGSSKNHYITLNILRTTKAMRVTYYYVASGVYLIFLCNAYRTVSTEALPVLAGDIPVYLEIQHWFQCI
jgi:hypothetical protein